MTGDLPNVDGYTGLTHIDSGGSSRIYSAHDECHNRDVAIKVLTTKSLDLTIRQSFRREVEAMERVSGHPHIMSMYDSGFTVDGTPYLVMPLYTDGSYGDRIKAEGPMKWVETVDVGIKIASALQSAHERHVLHRDVKPANIFIGRFRSDPVLGDFGISTVLDEGKTTTVAVAYTLTYVAPEVLSGKRQTFQTDIYSLGVTLRHMLTGCPAFAAQTTVGLVAQILSFPPVPLMLELSTGLVDLLDSMVAKDPSDRPQSVDEVVAGLRSVQRARPSVAGSEVDSEIVGLGSGVEASAAAIDVTLLYDSEVVRGARGAKSSDRDDATERLRAGISGSSEFTLSEPKRLLGHNASVNALSFSPDGLTLVTASDDRTVMFWDVLIGQPHLTIDGHQGRVNDVKFSPDGLAAATASEDELVKLWNVETGNLLHTLRGHSSNVNSVAFSPDGATLASASFDGSVILWDVATGENRQRLGGNLVLNSVHSVTYRSDGFALATGSFDGTLILWDAESGQKQLTVEDHADWITSVAFSPDGNRLATASVDGSVIVRDAITAQKQFVLSGFVDRVVSVAFTADSKALVSVGAGGLAFWDAVTGKAHASRVDDSGWSDSGWTSGLALVDVAQTGDRFAVVGSSVLVWNIDGGLGSDKSGAAQDSAESSNVIEF